jgi:hypothetical protein
VGGQAIHEITPEGKPAQTAVTEVAHKDGESLVLCEPLTGRTHQIRLHLRHLGAPIANDPLYGPSAEAGAGDAEAGSGAKRPGAETEEAGAKRAKAGEGGTGAGLEGAGSGGVAGADGGAETAEEPSGAAAVVLQERAREDAALGFDAHPEWLPPALPCARRAGAAGAAAVLTRPRGRRDEACIHCQSAVRQGCRGYYVPPKQKVLLLSPQRLPRPRPCLLARRPPTSPRAPAPARVARERCTRVTRGGGRADSTTTRR